MPDIPYIASFFVYSYSVPTPTGLMTAFTFKPAVDRHYLGRILAPGTASINPVPPERLMVPLGVTGHRYLGISAAEAVEAARRGDYGLSWEPNLEVVDVPG